MVGGKPAQIAWLKYSGYLKKPENIEDFQDLKTDF
jgi:hypothetical protein